MENYLRGSALKKVWLIRQSKDWQAARKLPKGEPKSKQRVARAQAFQVVKKKYGLEQTQMEAQARAFGVNLAKQDIWIGASFPTHVEQKIVLRVLDSAENMLYGRSRRLRFKGHARGVRSIENKTDKSGIRFREVGGKYGIYYQEMFLPILFNARDQVHQHALEHRVKYSQIIRYKRKGKTRFKVQLSQEGQPCEKRYQKNGSHIDFRTGESVQHQAGDLKHPRTRGKVGIDIGPSKYAMVGIETGYAVIGRFCDQLKDHEAEIRLKKRHISRQQRASNPDNYHPNFQDKHTQGAGPGHWKQGSVKKGRKLWVVSNRQQRVQDELNELDRKLVATRKKLQLTLKNQVIQLGDEVYFEKVSLEAWQKMWGRSISSRAPGVFTRALKQLAESADFTVNEFPTRNTYLSQRCQCGHREKKKLSQRVHKCSECGRVMDRDLYSAYLATAIDDQGEYCANQLSDWSGQEAVLRAAWTRGNSQGIPATAEPPWPSDPVRQSLTQAAASMGQSGLHAKREAGGNANYASASVIVKAKTRNTQEGADPVVGTSPNKVLGSENAPYPCGERESGRGNGYQLARTS